MTTRPRMLAIALAALLAGPGAIATVAAQPAPPIYGSQLMTQHERLEYRERLRNAHTAQERERVRLEHHRAMQERARERGVRLPDMPPARPGPRAGGVGPGPGGGAGPGPRGGMGPGPGAGPGPGFGPGPGAGPGAGGGAGGPGGR